MVKRRGILLTEKSLGKVFKVQQLGVSEETKVMYNRDVTATVENPEWVTRI